MIYQFGKHQDCPSEMSFGCENPSRNMEAAFVNSIVDLITDSLDINHNERRNFKSLLEKVIGGSINSHSKPGLLQQYEAYILDQAAERFHDTLKIPKTIEVNHSHANHAKYADLVKYINENFSANKIPAGNGSTETK